MGLTEYVLSQGLVMAVDHIDKSGIVLKTVTEIDLAADKRLGEKGSERLQERIVTQLLLPICCELMKENNERFNTILEQTQHRLEWGSVERRSDYRGESKPRQNFQPDNRP